MLSTTDVAFGERITCDSRHFYAGGARIWMNGANTPWFAWNDFGGGFDYRQWNSHFQLLHDNGINATRVWVTCHGGGGVQIDSGGHVTGATPSFWSHLDSLFQIAQDKQIYIHATLISFDHTVKDNPHYEEWRKMYQSSTTIDAFCANYVIPFVIRYKNNPWLWCIEPCNEIEWVNEDPDRGGIAWHWLQMFVGKVAAAVHDHSQVLVTQGAACIKWNSTTCPAAVGNMFGDSQLQAQVPKANARLDFYGPHHYPWQDPYFGIPFYGTPAQYGVPCDKPAIIGECPAHGSTGHSITDDYHNGYTHGWQGVLAWTSNGVDNNGSLVELGPATRFMRKKTAGAGF